MKQVKNLTEKGQSLLEVTITLGISISIIVALTITTVQGLRGTQFAQNQVQATKFAQEGLERVRLLKNTNTPITYLGATYYWNSTTSTNWIWTSQSLPFTFQFPTNCITVACNQLLPLSGPLSSQGEIINGVYYRKITLENFQPNSSSPTDPNALKVTSIVSWTDFTGPHQSNLITVISKY